MQCSFADHHPSRNPEPDPLENIPWVLLRPLRVCCIQCGLPGLDIGFGGADPFCALENLPEDIQSEIDWDTNVCSDEAIDVPWAECVETVKNDDD